MTETPKFELAYSYGRFIAAINLTALIAWFLVTTFWFSIILLEVPLVWPNLFGYAAAFYILGFLIGAPIALLSCWFIGAPMLWYLMRTPMTYGRTILYCLWVPTVIGFILLIRESLGYKPILYAVKWEGLALVMAILAIITGLLVHYILFSSTASRTRHPE